MNRNIKPRERINQTFTQKYFYMKSQHQKIDFESQVQHKKIQNINNKNNHNNQTILVKALSPKQKESQKIIIQNQHYQYIIIHISQLQKGVKITLNSLNNISTSEIIFTNQSMEVQKQKVKHSFPLSGITNSTKYIKLILKSFYQTILKIIIQSLKGKIKQKNILMNLSQNYQITSNSILQIDPYLLIEQSENIRRKKFGSNQKQFTLTSSKSASIIQTMMKNPLKLEQKQYHNHTNASTKRLQLNQSRLTNSSQMTLNQSRCCKLSANIQKINTYMDSKKKPAVLGVIKNVGNIINSQSSKKLNQIEYNKKIFDKRNKLHTQYYEDQMQTNRFLKTQLDEQQSNKKNKKKVLLLPMNKNIDLNKIVVSGKKKQEDNNIKMYRNNLQMKGWIISNK